MSSAFHIRCKLQGIDAQSEYNLGQLLLSFLNLFGNTFNYQAKAVSVRAVSGLSLASVAALLTAVEVFVLTFVDLIRYWK